MKRIKLPPKQTCLRCGHQWIPRTMQIHLCPKCKSVLWDQPRKAQ